MFISNAEKEQMQRSISRLESEIKATSRLLFELIEKINTSKKPPSSNRTAEAPWGYKKDGTPKKQSGRKKIIMKVGQP